jgi:uncharacterized protein (TIGR02569 family)
MSAVPPNDVLAAFEVLRDPEPLAGGMGVAWRAGDLVLKPVDNVDVHAWTCQVQDGWTSATVRVPRPVRPVIGEGWSVAGWGAHRWLPGTTARAGDDPDRFREGVDAFHAAIAHLDPPECFGRRDDAWARADRIAFEGGAPVGSREVLDLLQRARSALRPIALPAQVVHGDVGGNMLWHDELPPALIDFSPYHRPPGWPLAVAAMDAVCWEDADPALLDRWSDVDQWDQLLLRAVVFRLATRGVGESLDWPQPGSDGYVARRGANVDLVLARVAAAA